MDILYPFNSQYNPAPAVVNRFSRREGAIRRARFTTRDRNWSGRVAASISGRGGAKTHAHRGLSPPKASPHRPLESGRFYGSRRREQIAAPRCNTNRAGLARPTIPASSLGLGYLVAHQEIPAPSPSAGGFGKRIPNPYDVGIRFRPRSLHKEQGIQGRLLRVVEKHDPTIFEVLLAD